MNMLLPAHVARSAAPAGHEPQLSLCQRNLRVSLGPRALEPAVTVLGISYFVPGGISTSSEAGVMDRTAGLRCIVGNDHIFRTRDRSHKITDTLYILHYNN